MHNIKMRKMNKLFLGLLAFLLTMSVGYALFSDSVNVSGTATAKANWDLTVSCEKGVSSNMLTALEITASETGENGYSSETCSVSGNNVTIATSLSYPGSHRYYTVKIKNTGSMDAVIRSDDSIDPSSYKLQLYYKSNDSLYREYVKGSDSNFSTVIDNYSEMFLAVAGVADTNGTVIIDDDTLISKNMIYKNSSGENYLKLGPNQSLVLLFVAVWDEAAVSTSYYSKTIAQYSFDFSQMTSDLTIDPNGYTCFAGC